MESERLENRHFLWKSGRRIYRSVNHNSANQIVSKVEAGLSGNELFECRKAGIFIRLQKLLRQNWKNQSEGEFKWQKQGFLIKN